MLPPDPDAPPFPGDGLSAEAFRIVRPAYGAGSLADLLPSVCAVLGVPGAVDVLGLGGRLDGVDRVGVLLVDGLGAYQLPLIAPFAPVLTELAGDLTLTTGVPSTTPVSLVTVGTGVPPGAHGVLGFTVRRPDGRVLNHIQWQDDPDPYLWQPVPTVLETAAAAGVAVTVVSRSLYRGTGLSTAANRGGRYHVADDGPAVADGMLAALRSGPGLVYGYHPDLDKAGHEEGVGSPSWREAARGVDLILDRLAHGLPPGAALLVIADHGQLNVPPDGRHDLSTGVLSDGVAGVAGEPRARYLHVADGALDDVVANWRSVLGDGARVLRRDEAIAEGWYGPVPPAHAGRIGDVVVLCQGRTVVVAPGWEPERAGQLVAYHGSVTAAEMTVPLVIIR
ncbi:alkaline phosphatase family protein [Actinoplanes sp. NEAU-A12]|uniref:Alkaline phosphatase family protein n=1 Tax=Actinoplanes sandaracinus TaxID=3045177 RepID=A0ABT6WDZ1_9ACTN|nr:alkaline phosphatase family protein [Actinoplanes sandaracinus]MDI6097928.1 alkaline phosphatase family protein [Actinoplanes sandaracinus]